MGRLDGSRALVTGAGSGIGAAIASALAGEGATLTLVGRDRTRLEARALALGGAATVSCDVTDEAAVAQLAAAVGSIDLLVNNAGGVESAPLARTGLALFRRMLDLNTTAAFLLCRAFMPAMAERGEGRVVNVASTAGERGYPYVAAYCASKHGLVGLTRALALEFASSGVTVNAVCPGYTETGLLDRAVGEIVAASGRERDEVRAALGRDNASGRFVQPAEVASAVAWLCEPAQAAVTGRTLTVAGAEVV
jgi:NAD(P)-dependent dehydrogenase (short-subunit alcohol dehydrogenase family)